MDTLKDLQKLGKDSATLKDLQKLGKDSATLKDLQELLTTHENDEEITPW